MRVDASKVVLWLTGIFVLIQVVVPAKTNPESDPSKSLRVVKADHAAAIAAMARSCRDCHSNDTIWPWYSYVAPVSWLVAHDVNDGRRELNMSEFGTYPEQKQQHKLEEACEQVKQGEMPMWIYTLQHPDAKLQPGDVELICALAGTPAH
ncbi:MAG: heme-binding domain-containing protein [Vicinamibacterales bacterium]